MATPKYFSQLPNIDYKYAINKAGIHQSILIKDYFHHLVIRDDIFREDTIYMPYYIKNGERPDQISYDLYNDEQYYWIILHLNDIIDYYSDWPLSSDDLDLYVHKKYGSIENTEAPHHYETIETYDTEGNLIMPGRGTPGPDRGGLAMSGMVVPENFEYTYPSYPGSSVFSTKSGSTGIEASCTAITNRRYEYDLNEDKSQIYVLKKKFITDYTKEIRQYFKSIDDMESQLTVGDLP